MNEHIKVFLRIKPNVENIIKLVNEDCTVYKVQNNQLHLYEKKKSYNDMNELKTKTFNFNHIFDIHVKQNEIFDVLGKNLINNFMNGYNSSILAYGNTNSGKTYTLYGDRNIGEENQNYGLIYYSLKYLFDLKNINKDTEISISVVEIYLEKIRDLGKLFQLYHISTTTNDTITYYSQFHDNIIREDENGNTYVDNITLLPIKNIEDVKEIIDLCFKYRKTYSTKKNRVSSRSHCLLTVYQHKNIKEKELISQINFIDLAGSEKFNDIEMINKKELININNTLSILNRVIMALSTKNKITKNMENKICGNEKVKMNMNNIPNIHIPYRDSKLTRLLKNSLNGNSFNYILICLNLNTYKIDDFINSLIFAKRCKTIKQKIKKNKTKKYCSNSENEKSNNTSEESSYESYDSTCDLYHSINNKNKNNHDKNNHDKNTFHNNLYYYKGKKIKMKNINNHTDIMINKLLNYFTLLIRKKYNDMIKQKNSIFNNLIKIIKIEEQNKDQLKNHKNYLLNILKRKKKQLKYNKEYLNNILHSKKHTLQYEENKDTNKIVTDLSISPFEENENLKEKSHSNFLKLSYDNNKQHNNKMNKQTNNVTTDVVNEKKFNDNIYNDNIYNDNIYNDNIYNDNNKEENHHHNVNNDDFIYNNSKMNQSQNMHPTFNSNTTKIVDNKHIKNKEPNQKDILYEQENISNSSIYINSSKKQDHIKRIYSDIHTLYQLELKELHKKKIYIEEINSMNSNLFNLMNKFANMLRNIYLNKYSVVIKNGNKKLNLSNYYYTNINQTYNINDFYKNGENILNTNNFKNINEDIFYIYQKINQ
ncbi:kinesin-like protein, putative [Plasmodium gaboni]|uniref:Kinesin-like protein n=1 Tax=Plasmodium gaboni TaxID=647221 RepID=A0ABY1UQR1_9APIC|nr:kinesin-like protein, putative [Plasmodium gaboni]